MSRQLTKQVKKTSGVTNMVAPLSTQHSVENREWGATQTNYWSHLSALRTNPLHGEVLAHSTGVEPSRITKQGTTLRERRTQWQATPKGIDVWELVRPLEPRGTGAAPVGEWVVDEHTQHLFTAPPTIRRGDVPSAVSTKKGGGGGGTASKWDKVTHQMDALPQAVQTGVRMYLGEPTFVDAGLCRFTKNGTADAFEVALLGFNKGKAVAVFAEKDAPLGGGADGAAWKVTQVSGAVGVSPDRQVAPQVARLQLGETT